MDGDETKLGHKDWRTLQGRWVEIIRTGPQRVLLDAEGRAIPSRAAREVHGVIPDVIFIRDDGWSLGAQKDLAAVAFDLWKGAWIGYALRGDREARPIEELHLGKNLPFG